MTRYRKLLSRLPGSWLPLRALALAAGAYGLLFYFVVLGIPRRGTAI